MTTSFQVITINNPTTLAFADGYYEMQLCEAIQSRNSEKAWVKVG